VFVTCRTKSTRLPGKALLSISPGVSVIEHVLRRAKSIGADFPVILCTTLEDEDNILVEIAEREGVATYRGSTNDKLDRWRSAAKHYDVEYFATFDADDLFCSPQLIKNYLLRANDYEEDLIQASGMISGIFTYGVRVSGLEKGCSHKSSVNTEMMWEFFKCTPGIRIGELNEIPPQFRRRDMRFTLDYPEDLLFFRRVFLELGYSSNLEVDHIVEFLASNMNLVDINFFRENDYIQNQEKTILEERGKN